MSKTTFLKVLMIAGMALILAQCSGDQGADEQTQTDETADDAGGDDSVSSDSATNPDIGINALPEDDGTAASEGSDSADSTDETVSVGATSVDEGTVKDTEESSDGSETAEVSGDETSCASLAASKEDSDGDGEIDACDYDYDGDGDGLASAIDLDDAVANDWWYVDAVHGDLFALATDSDYTYTLTFVAGVKIAIVSSFTITLRGQTFVKGVTDSSKSVGTNTGCTSEDASDYGICILTKTRNMGSMFTVDPSVFSQPATKAKKEYPVVVPNSGVTGFPGSGGN